MASAIELIDTETINSSNAVAMERRGSRSSACMEQYCTAVDTSEVFVLRSGESIPRQVRDVLRAARREWVRMQRLPYEHRCSDQSSKLMKCIQRIISMECIHKESMEERAGLQPSPLHRLKILFIRALNAKLHEDLVFTTELREVTVATMQAAMSSDMQHRLKHCFYCHKELIQRSRCSHCKFAGYCSDNCQKKDWCNHREVCERIRKANRKPTANEVFRALAAMNEDLRPFVASLNEDFHIQVAMCTKYYVRAEWAYDIRMVFKSHDQIVFVVYPTVLVTSNALFWEPFEFHTPNITRASDGGKAQVGTHLQVTLNEQTFNQLECCQCGGLPNLMNSNRDCLHLFCTKCVSSCRAREKCKQCGCKIETLILLSKVMEQQEGHSQGGRTSCTERKKTKHLREALCAVVEDDGSPTQRNTNRPAKAT